MEQIRISRIEERLVEIRNLKVILDRDVAVLYGVETKRINEAVKNNPEKFPDGYVFQLTANETISLRSKISTLDESEFGRGKHSKFGIKAFTEKGLYMLATILKSPMATQTTIDIIETYAKIKDLARTISSLSNQSKADKDLLSKGSELISELIDNNLETDGTETTVELNFALLKVKHTIKRKSKP